jgi:hypothetical protein
VGLCCRRLVVWKAFFIFFPFFFSNLMFGVKMNESYTHDLQVQNFYLKDLNYPSTKIKKNLFLFFLVVEPPL